MFPDGATTEGYHTFQETPSITKQAPGGFVNDVSQKTTENFSTGKNTVLTTPTINTVSKTSHTTNLINENQTKITTTEIGLSTSREESQLSIFISTSSAKPVVTAMEETNQNCSTNWSDWSDCESTNFCGSGTHFRSRVNEKCEEIKETEDCESFPCIKIAQLSSPKSFCSKSCGGGRMMRSSACMQFDRRKYKNFLKTDQHPSIADFYYEVDTKVCTNTEQFTNTSFAAEEVDCCNHTCTYKQGMSICKEKHQIRRPAFIC